MPSALKPQSMYQRSLSVRKAHAKQRRNNLQYRRLIERALVVTLVVFFLYQILNAPVSVPHPKILSRLRGHCPRNCKGFYAEPRTQVTIIIDVPLRLMHEGHLVSDVQKLRHKLVVSLLKTVTALERQEYYITLVIAASRRDGPWIKKYVRVPKWMKRKLHFYEHTDVDIRMHLNELAMLAYNEGAEYVVRATPDTEYTTKEWLSKSIGALKAMNNIGIVGPINYYNPLQSDLITHYIVSRKHFEIFGHFIPASLLRKWEDDWMTRVYARYGRVLNNWRIVQDQPEFHNYIELNYEDIYTFQDELRTGEMRLSAYLLSSEPSIEVVQHMDDESEVGFKTNDLSLRPAISSDKKIVAICICAKSTRDIATLKNSSLVSYFIPGLSRSITEEELDEYDFRLYIGFDDDDVFWLRHSESLKHSGFAPDWLSIETRFFPKRQFRVPFNEITTVAYDDGAEYFVRLNDDSDITASSKGWFSKGVLALENFKPKNLGVIGPKSSGDYQTILTHDMTHRTHMEIFGTYYPSVFSAIFVDNWISNVYPQARSVKLLDWKIDHRKKHGTRYEKQRMERQYLFGELLRGKERIRQWLYKFDSPSEI